MRDQKMESLINSIIGKNIGEVRISRNLSQSDIAELLSINLQEIHNYEDGFNQISAPILFLLAQSLHIPIEYFFDGIAFHFEGEKK